MPNVMPRIKKLLRATVLFFGRMVGYGLLCFLALAICVPLIERFWPSKLDISVALDERAEHFEGFSLATPDPVTYWSWRTEAPERYRVKSGRIDTLLVQRGYTMVDWAGVGLKDGKTVAYLIYSEQMKRVVVNDVSIYWPSRGHVSHRIGDPAAMSQTLRVSMERLAGRVGAQGIEDLLTLSRSYVRNTHASRDLQFVADQMALAWNRLHPEAAIRIPEMPQGDHYEEIS